MTIITQDGKTIQFCGGESGDDTIIDRRVADRREFDHNVPDHREGERRAPEPPPAPRKSIQERYDEKVSRHLDLWMEDLLTRLELMSMIDYTVTNQDGTEEEVNVTELELARAASIGR